MKKIKREKKEDRYNYQLKYYGTYYFCNLIQNVVQSNNMDYAGHFDRFFSTMGYLNLFQKESVLHDFIYFCIDQIINEDIDDVLYKKSDDFEVKDIKDSEFFICQVLDFHNIKRIKLEEWVKLEEYKHEFSDDIIYEYFKDYLMNEIHELITRLSEEVFHVLFQNRTFLFNFNLLVADWFTNMINEDDEDFADLFKRPGYFKRITIPSWVKRAVFYRDRGFCVFCPTDLSGNFDSLPRENYDHMVPLAQGGINDISNIQLTCEPCNKSKQEEASTTDVYRRIFITK